MAYTDPKLNPGVPRPPGGFPRNIEATSSRIFAEQAAVRRTNAEARAAVEGLDGLTVVGRVPEQAPFVDPRPPVAVEAMRYPTPGSVVAGVLLAPAQAADVVRVLEAAAADVSPMTTGRVFAQVAASIRGIGLPPGLAAEIHRRASAYLYGVRAARGTERGRLSPLLRGGRDSVEGLAMSAGLSALVAAAAADFDGDLGDLGDGADALVKAKKTQVATGPRGGKIIGYRTGKNGKRTAIYERPGGGDRAAVADGDKGDATGSGEPDAPKASQKLRERAHKLAKEADGDAAILRHAAEVSKLADDLDDAEAEAQQAQEAEQADAAEGAQEAEAEAAAEPAATEADPEVEAPTAPTDATAADAAEAEDARPVPEPANEALPQTNEPDPQERAPRLTPKIDMEPLIEEGTIGAPTDEGNPGPETQTEADLRELAEIRKDLQKMFDDLDRIEHLIASEYVPLFNALKADIRRAARKAEEGRAAMNASSTFSDVLNFLWDKVAAFVEFIRKMAAAGLKAAAGKITGKGKGGGDKGTRKSFEVYGDALRKSGAVGIQPDVALALVDVILAAKRRGAIDEVVEQALALVDEGDAEFGYDGDGDADDVAWLEDEFERGDGGAAPTKAQLDYASGLLADVTEAEWRAKTGKETKPTRGRLAGMQRRNVSRAIADLAELARGMDDDGDLDEMEIPDGLIPFLTEFAKACGLEKGAGHKYIRRVPKPGGGYRYYYRVSGVTRDVGKDLVAGAAFRLAHDGKEGHFHVTARDGDKVTLRHDESGREMQVDARALGEMLRKEHAQVVQAKREAITKEIEQAKKTGTGKQLERLKAEAERMGVSDAPTPKPKAPTRQPKDDPKGAARKRLSALASGMAPGERVVFQYNPAEKERQAAFDRAAEFSGDGTYAGVNFRINQFNENSAISTDGYRIAMVPVRGPRAVAGSRVAYNKEGDTLTNYYPDVVRTLDRMNLHGGSAVDSGRLVEALDAVLKLGGRGKAPKDVMLRNAGGRLSLVVPGGADKSIPESGLSVDLGQQSGFDDGPFQIVLNAQYLADALRGASGPVRIAGSGNSFGGDAGMPPGPVAIQREDGERHYIMPMRLDPSSEPKWSAGKVKKSLRPGLDALTKAVADFGVDIDDSDVHPQIPGVSEVVLPGGLRAKIETPKGAYRSGVDGDGNAWSVQMPAHYGEIVGTMGTDGDPLDVFVGDDLGAPYVYVVGLRDVLTGEHDEDKVFFGFPSREAAMRCYRDAYDRRDLTLDVRRLTVPEFQIWLANHGVKGVRVAGRQMRKGLDALRGAAGLPAEAPGPVDARADLMLAAVKWRRAPDRLRERAARVEPPVFVPPMMKGERGVGTHATQAVALAAYLTAGRRR